MENYSGIGEKQVNQTGKQAKINKYFKYEARKTLFARDNFYKSVIAYLLCGFIASAFLYITYLIYRYLQQLNVSTMSSDAIQALNCTVCAILTVSGLFFTFSALIGAYDMLHRFQNLPQREILAPDMAKLGDVLSPIANVDALRSTFKLYLIILAQTVVTVIPATVITELIINMQADRALKIFLITVVVFITLNVLMLIAFLLLPYPYIRDCKPHLSVVETYRLSVRCAFGQLFRAYSLLGSFSGLIILSALTFGVLFIVYTIPYMSLCYSKLGAYMFNIYSVKEN